MVKEEDTGLIHRRDIDQIVEIPPPYDDEENDSKDKIGKKSIRIPFFNSESKKEEEEEVRGIIEEEPSADEAETLANRRARPKRKCVEQSKNRYRDSLLDASIHEGLP